MNYGPSIGPVSLTGPHPSSSCHPQEKMSERNFAEWSRAGDHQPWRLLPHSRHGVIQPSEIHIFQSTYHTHTAPTSLVIIKRLYIINNLLLLSRAALTRPASLNPAWFSLLNWWMNVIIKMLGLDSLLSLLWHTAATHSFAQITHKITWTIFAPSEKNTGPSENVFPFVWCPGH